MACSRLGRVLLGLLLTALGAAEASAEVPATINYQGLVLTSGGTPVAGPVSIEVGIWDSATAGNRLYRERHLNTPLVNGVYNLLLGSGSNPIGTFSADTFSAPNRWLELMVDGETLTPRQPFTSVAYALRTGDADRIGGRDAAALMPRSGGNFTGLIGVNGPNGNSHVLLSSVPDNPNNGLVAVLNPEGVARAQMIVNASGQGAVSAFTPTGSGNATLGGGQNGGLVSTSSNQGRIATLLGETNDGGGLIAAYNANQQARALVSGGGDLGFVGVFGPNGKENVTLDATTTKANHGRASVHDANGMSRASMFVDDAGNGHLSVLGAGRTETFGGQVTLNDAAGVVKVLLTVDAASQGVVDIVRNTGPPLAGAFRVREGGDAFLALFGPTGSAGNINVLLGAVDGDPNRGTMSVHDRNSVARAGMFVNASGRGQIFADVKNFVVDHPTRPGKQIIYTSLEGPEVAIYHRGVTRLVGGRATIELPEHFAALATPGSATVQLTPVSLKSKGLGVARMADDRIEIGELYNGTGTYDVHFVVHALRRGYESHQPVVATAEFLARQAWNEPARPVEVWRGPPLPLPQPAVPNVAAGSGERAHLESLLWALDAALTPQADNR